MIMSSYSWAVIGAGPAGIASVGKLLDSGVNHEDIIWIDPHFTVGDFGAYWHLVLSNTQVWRFKKYLEGISSFGFSDKDEHFDFDDLDENDTCQLSYVADVLSWVTRGLLKQVHSIKTKIERLSLSDQRWVLHYGESVLKADNVIMAVGSDPVTLANDRETIDLATALDKQKLAAAVQENDTVALFGSSHSAVIILRYLTEIGVKHVYNFMREPLKFAVDFNDWILFDNTGLKGTTADWARQNLLGNLPENITQVYSDEVNTTKYLSKCSKVIYAIGFRPRSIEIDGFAKVAYNPHNGIIAPGLFGVGIAFPEIVTDRYGNKESSVGLLKFKHYLDRVMPLWFKYALCHVDMSRSGQNS